MSLRTFPENFLWGVATSAAQIEGATQEGGRGESIWDRFATMPGKIEDRSTPAVACDHYHRWREDVELLRRLGVGAYRFSVAWPRVLPAGGGKVNEEGLAFYDALVDGLLAANIRPMVTLYHWDLPQALQDRGGWASRSIVDAFERYADVVAERLGDRVDLWVTHNEPWCIATLGHEEGHHAPGHRYAPEALHVAHHVLVSHGKAVARIRERAPDAEVGIVLNLTPADAASSRPEDVDAARWFDGFFNRWYLDPLLRGEYPEDAVEDRRRRGHLPAGELPFVEDGDFDLITAPTDFLGVNYYSRVVMRADENGRPEAVPQGAPDERTTMGWEIHPDGLRKLLLRLHREYRVGPIHITENGASFDDAPGPDGSIPDVARIRYVREHLEAAQAALEEGVDLRGYFLWSLLDNFEWGHGYDRRFGLVHMDYASLTRTPKDSFDWYRSVVTANALDAAATPIR